MATPVAIPPLFSISTLSEYIGVPEATLYVWRSQGKGPKGFRVGKYVRYRSEDVDAWLNEQRAKESA
jgi:excisionase family DNA binding protein